MKKIKLFSFLMLFTLSAAGCNLSDSSSSIINESGNSSSVVTDATIVEFDVNESKVDEIDVGDTYTAKSITAKDNYGNYYVTEISAFDPSGKEVTVTNNSFVCSVMGKYKVTYTVNYNVSDTVSKSMHVNVVDVSAPTVDTELYIHNICRPGQVVDLTDFNIVDNSGESLIPTINVLFNGIEEVALVDNKFTAEKEGTYVLEVTATDSSENEMFEEYFIHTYMDFEHGYSFDLNDTYGTDVVDDYAYEGSYSYEFGAFDSNISWFNDYSMLGNIKIIDDEAKYVSFWIYFENKDYVNIMKAIYHDTVIYDRSGTKLPNYHLGGFEMKGAEWYRIVVNMDELVFEGEFFDHDDAVANPDTLGQIPFYFGVWDNAINNGASKSQKIYIDNVELTNDPDDIEYITPESDYDFPENCIVDFETEEQLEAFTPSWRSTYTRSTKYKTSGEYSMKFTPYITYSALTFTGFCSGITALEEYNYLSTNVYIDDNSGNNVYDDNTRIVLNLGFKAEDGSTKSLQSYSIQENKKWINLTFDLGEYNQYSLTSNSFYLSMWKYINGEVVSTNEYEDVDLYFDDFYLGKTIKYNPGEIITNLPYASKTGGDDLYTQVSASQTGYIEAGTVAKYGVANGTYENYTMFNKNYLGNSEDATKSYLTSDKIYTTPMENNNNALIVIEATDNCFAKFILDESLFDIYFWGNVYIRKYSASASLWTQIDYVQSGDKAVLAEHIQCDYQKLEVGDKLVLEIQNRSGSMRYFAYPSGIAIATPLEEGQTIELKTPTNVSVTSNYGLYKVAFTEVNGASSYTMTLTDSEGNVVTGYENVAVTNGQEFNFEGLVDGTYNVQIQAIGTGIYTSSKLSEKIEFNYTAPVALTMEEVKAALLNTENSFNAITNINTLIDGGTDEYMTIGLLDNGTELPVVPNTPNQWCGFVSGFRVQLMDNATPNAWYYTYTAKQDGYVYIDQQFISWNNVEANFTATIGDEVVYTKDHTLVTDQAFDDKIAVYLERGETLKVQFNRKTEITSRITVAVKYLNITFVATKEATLPSEYNSLIEYLEA